MDAETSVDARRSWPDFCKYQPTAATADHILRQGREQAGSALPIPTPDGA